MRKIISGGFYRGQRTYVLSAVGIVGAIGAYLVGDVDIFETLQSVFTLGGIYFLRKSNDDNNKRNNDGKHTRKIQK